MMKRDKLEDGDGSQNPFYNLERSSVIQEARVFNDTPIVPRKCILTLSKLLYLINQGENISNKEATSAFFAMTRLFQSKDVTLRQMVYLGIKEMANIADDVIIVTSSLTKDMAGKEDLFRAPAIRALCLITDASMLHAMERYMKQAVVDRYHAVSSAALVSSLHLCNTGGGFDLVKRWFNEIQEAFSADNSMVQYHALGLLYRIRKNDKLAVTKMVTKLMKTVRSPYATCLLIRIACKLIEEDADSQLSAGMIDFIESCLRHKSEIVIFEAAHAMVNMSRSTSKDLVAAVSVLQLFCSSPKATLRFAAVRTLSKVAMTHPSAVTTCNLDLENLITDGNRSIATLAITTLLKTGNEGSVDRLMKQIQSFMSEISDEFKIVVVMSIGALAKKFPKKHGVMMNFLSSMLRDEGGFEYKKAIADTIISIIDDNPQAKEAGLAHLCEFIEDCEHTVLATRILHLLGAEGPRAATPAKYIRFIYNRVILENAAVRAAAVTALAKFGAHCEELLPSVLVLLQRCLHDTDDEVRDRAAYYHNILREKQRALNSAYILNSSQVSIVGLERALHAYTLDPQETPFDMSTVPLDTKPIQDQQAPSAPGASVTRPGSTRAAASVQDIYAEQLAKVEACADLGPLFKSSKKPIHLTEDETEYVVKCVKHTFPNHMVFQFDCLNTLNDQQLDNVTVMMEEDSGIFEVVHYVPIQSLKYNNQQTTYTIVAMPEDHTEVMGTFQCTLKFQVRDCDPNTGEPEDDGYDEEYQLEEVEVAVADHTAGALKPNFAASWDEVGPTNELEDTFALSTMKSLEEAVANIIQFMGLQPCERSDKVAEGKSSHTLLLAGMFRGGHNVLVRARLALQDSVTMQITVRSDDPTVSEIITNAVG